MSSAVWAMSGVWLFDSSVPLLLDEVEQVRHHLEVRGHVRVVPVEVHVVEGDLDDVLDAVAQLTRGRRGIAAGPSPPTATCCTVLWSSLPDWRPMMRRSPRLT